MESIGDCRNVRAVGLGELQHLQDTADDGEALPGGQIHQQAAHHLDLLVITRVTGHPEEQGAVEVEDRLIGVEPEGLVPGGTGVGVTIEPEPGRTEVVPRHRVAVIHTQGHFQIVHRLDRSLRAGWIGEIEAERSERATQIGLAIAGIGFDGIAEAPLGKEQVGGLCGDVGADGTVEIRIDGALRHLRYRCQPDGQPPYRSDGGKSHPARHQGDLRLPHHADGEAEQKERRGQHRDDRHVLARLGAPGPGHLGVGLLHFDRPVCRTAALLHEPGPGEVAVGELILAADQLGEGRRLSTDHVEGIRQGGGERRSRHRTIEADRGPTGIVAVSVDDQFLADLALQDPPLLQAGHPGRLGAPQRGRSTVARLAVQVRKQCANQADHHDQHRHRGGKASGPSLVGHASSNNVSSTPATKPTPSPPRK